MMIEFETDRLILKVVDESYAKVILDYYIRNKDFLKEWDPLRDDSFYTLEYHKEQLRYDLEGMKNSNLFRLWIFKKEDEEFKKVIGTIAFSNIVWGSFLSCFLGYKLDKDEINKGYMTEALKKGIDIVFNKLKLHRIEANIMPRNRASLAVVKKLGFYEEGLAKKYLKINGKWEDHIHMVLLNEELE